MRPERVLAVLLHHRLEIRSHINAIARTGANFTTMKRIGLLVSVVLLARSAKGEDAANNDRSSPNDDANKVSCRVAVCLSGHVRSFVHPVVPLSVRRNVIEAIEDSGCSVDVFAYAATEDSGTLVEQQVSTL